MNIIVIGEKFKDIFLTGTVNRLNMEAPSPILDGSPLLSKASNDGGAGNVYQNVLSLFPGVNAGLLCQPETITKTRFIDSRSSYTLLRVDENDKVGESLNFDKFLEFYKNFCIIYKKVDAIIFSDYCKGFLTKHGIEQIVQFCYNNNILTFLDTRKILGNWSRKIDFVKINEKEFNDNGDISTIMYCKSLLVTLGAKGIWWVNEDIIFPVKEVGVVNLSGAGDSVLAGFVIKYLETKDIQESIRYANRVAAMAVSKQGVVAVRQEEVK